MLTKRFAFLRILLRIVLGIVFIPLFILFVVLTSLKFQLLNYSFVVNSFDRNNVYEKVTGLSRAIVEESHGETEVNLTPQLAREIVETNLKGILDFANGQSEDIELSLPGQEKTTLNRIAPNFPKQQLEYAQKIGDYSLIGWVTSLVFVTAILYFLMLLGIKNKDKGTEIYLITFSVIFIILCIVLRFFLMQATSEWVKGNEPSQHLLAMLASSILPEIVYTWIFIAGFLSIFAITMLILRKYKKF